MKIDAILLKVNQQDFPITLAFEMKEEFYFRIVYYKKKNPHSHYIELNNPEYDKFYTNELYTYELHDYQLTHSQKKIIVQYLMRRLKYKFSFYFSNDDDRFYIKIVNNSLQLKQELKKLYLMLDQQVGISKISNPKEFFE